MTTTTLNAPKLSASTPDRPATPGIWARLWAALEAQGQRRAEAELRRLAAHHHFSDPTLASRLRQVADQTAHRV